MTTPKADTINGTTAGVDPSWPSDWLRATLGMCALKSLEAGPSYGYAIITALEKSGLGSIKGGTLYPLLTRFETAGFLATEWRAGDGGPGRKYFALTQAGRTALAEQRTAWTLFTETTNNHLKADQQEGTP